VKILTLTIKKKWFDLIKSGQKKIEYRDSTLYWYKRFVGHHYDYIRFRNGYRKDSPSLLIELLYIRLQNQKTDLKEGLQFSLHLGQIIQEQKP